MKRDYIECDICGDIVYEGLIRKTYLAFKKVEFKILGFDDETIDFHICSECLNTLKNIINQERNKENANKK